MLILKSVWIIFDAAFSAYKLVLHLSATWILFIASSLLHYLPAVLCTNDGWFMLLFLGYYFALHYAIKQYLLPMGPRIVRKLFFLHFQILFCSFFHILFLFPFCAWNFLTVVYFAHLTYPVRILAANTNAVYETSSFTF